MTRPTSKMIACFFLAILSLAAAASFQKSKFPFLQHVRFILKKFIFVRKFFASQKKLLLKLYLFFFWVVFRVGQHICIRILNKNIFFCLFCHDFIAMFILLKRGLNLWFKPRYFKIRQFLCFLKTWNVLRSWDVIKSS
jgi:hypothetical protein